MAVKPALNLIATEKTVDTLLLVSDMPERALIAEVFLDDRQTREYVYLEREENEERELQANLDQSTFTIMVIVMVSLISIIVSAGVIYWFM
jgi:hypothetical protein